MKKIIAIFCIFAFLLGEESQDLKSLDETNDLTPETKWGKFLKVGIGPALAKEFRGSLFSFSASAGIIIHPQEDFQHLFSLDFDYASLANWYAKSIYANPQAIAFIKSDGNNFAITLNYGASNKLPFLGWDARIITALGIGITHTSANTIISNLRDSANNTGFIIRPNITLRSVFAEHHALDFTIKPDLLGISRLGMHSLTNWYFYFSYAFLSF